MGYGFNRYLKTKSFFYTFKIFILYDTIYHIIMESSNTVFESNISEKSATCRLSGDEIDFIDNIWNGKFSEFVHQSIRKEMETVKQKNRLASVKDVNLNVLLMGFGLFFFTLGLRSTTSLEMVLSYAFGMFLFGFGVTGGLLIALQSTRKHRQ